MFDWFKSLSGVALPIAVWIAIVTLVVREVIDGHKKRQERKRKEKAISLLIGQELELNYWALDSLMYALKYLDQDSYSYELKTNFDGVKLVKWDSGDGYTTASLPVFVTKQYERLLPDILLLDKGANRQLEKLNNRDRTMRARYDETKAVFDTNHVDPKLDFKKHQSEKGVFKIKLLGKNDGRRLMLIPNSNKTVYYVSSILTHDQLDQR